MRFNHFYLALTVAATCSFIAACTQQDAPEAVSLPQNASVSGVLTCDPIDQWPSFEKPVSLVIEGDRITTEDMGIEPDANRFETWSGVIEGNEVSLSGRYRHPDQSGPRPVTLTGELVNGQIKLSGMRGPRTCTYASSSIEAV